MIDRYLKAPSIEDIWLDLQEVGLASQNEDGSFMPAEGVSVDMIDNKPYPNAPPGLLELDIKAPELTEDKIQNHYSKSENWRGPHANVRLLMQEDADALDSAPLSNGSELLSVPDTPYRVWAS